METWRHMARAHFAPLAMPRLREPVSDARASATPPGVGLSGERDMTPKGNRLRGSAHTGLTYRGIDVCDRCGAPLMPGEALAGLCRKCLPRHERPRKGRRAEGT